MPPARISSSVTDKGQTFCNACVGRTLLSDAFDFAFDLDFDTHMPNRTLDRKYDYRRMLPHHQKAGRALFVTFCKGNRTAFAPETRDAILQHCLHDRGKRYELHAAVVMPDHVHLLPTPLRDEKGWPYSLPAILKLLKGVSARTVNKLSGSSGPVWQEESFDHVLRSQESFEKKLEYLRQNPVRRALVNKPDYKWLWVEPTAGKQDNSGGSDTPVRRS
jgi:putative transposase